MPSATAGSSAAPIGMLVGGGRLPIEIAQSIQRRGGQVHAVLIGGEADQDWSSIPHTCVGWGQVGGMVGALKAAGCSDLVIIGRVKRPDLWSLRPDLGFWRALPRIVRLVRAGGDDSVLRRVVRFFEDQGLRVRGPSEIAPELVVPEGTLGRHAVPAETAGDIALGFEIVSVLGALDIGQAVIMEDGRLVAVEGVEGTDGLMARVEAGKPGTRRVLVKAPKPGQELRVDMPVIGPQTVATAATQGLAGIALAAGGVLVAERSEAIRQADAASVFVVGVRQVAAEAVRPQASLRAHPLALLTSERPTAAGMADAAQGALAVARLAPFAARGSAIVARRHVLAVGVDESPAALVARARSLRQWGDRARWRRRGVLALSSADGIDASVIQAVAQAGLAGIVLARRPDTSHSLLAAAEAAKLFIAVSIPERPEPAP